MRNKKGIQIGQAFAAVLSVVLVATLVIVGIYLFVTLVSSFAGTSSGTKLNEAVTMTTSTGTLANSTLCQFGSLRVTAAANATAALSSGNYTVGTTTITNLTSMGNTWTVNYTYTWGGEACTASNNMITNFSNYPALIGLVGTIVLLALVIGVLISAFAVGGREGV